MRKIKTITPDEARASGIPDLRPIRYDVVDLGKDKLVKLGEILDASTTHDECRDQLKELDPSLDIDGWVSHTKGRVHVALVGSAEIEKELDESIRALAWGMVRGKIDYSLLARNRRSWIEKSGIDPTTSEGQQELAQRINTFVKGQYQELPKAEQTRTGWKNGALEPLEDITEPTVSPTVNYGAGGVFEGMVGYLNVTAEGKLTANVVDPRGHYDRMKKGLQALGRELPYTYDEFMAGIADVLSANKDALKEGDYRFYLRPVTSLKIPKGRGHTGLGLDQRDKRVSLSILTLTFGAYLDEKGSYVMASERIPPEVAIEALKVGGKYAFHVAIKERAKREGFTEALCMDMDGGVSEGTGENFYIIKEDPGGGMPTLITPKPGKGILEGRTRSIVMNLARDMEWNVEESEGISITAVTNANEALISGTLGEIGGIKKLTLTDEVANELRKGNLHPEDGELSQLVGEHEIGTGELGPRLKQLQEAYTAVIRLDRKTLSKIVGAQNCDKYFELMGVVDLGKPPEGFTPTYPS